MYTEGTFPGLRISIHAPREGGDFGYVPKEMCVENFNPRPPRGGRPLISAMFVSLRLFQSTPPARGATTFDIQVDDITGISIHAPREGGDLINRSLEPEIGNFNPRPPRGGRHWLVVKIHAAKLDFNPRPPRGGRPYRT